MATQYVWLAETLEAPPRYAVRSQALGGPVGELTPIATRARRFRSRDCCENWIASHAQDLPETLVAREHGFWC